LNAAVAANHVPRAGAGGVGLSVQIPGARSRILVNRNGQLTAAGAYYYDQVGQEPPASGFDYNQQATRSGQRMVIRLLDGTTRAVQVWDTRTNAFRPTVLGKKFLARALDKYTVSFPVLVNVTRTNGSIYQRQDWLPSTALPLGEIEVPRAMTEQEQIAEVKRRVATFLHTLPSDYTDHTETHTTKILLPGNDSGVASLLDTSRTTEYNKLTVNAQGHASAVLHRPLRQAKPWRFYFGGASEDAYAETDDQCVPYQLSRHLKRRGVEAFTQEELTGRLRDIAQRLYTDSPDNPYFSEDEHGRRVELDCATVGFTTAIVVELCRDLACPIHVMWSNCKIETYAPMRPKYDRVCFIVFGEHAYFLDDAGTKQHLARMRLSEPMPQAEFAVAKPRQKTAKIPPTREWEQFVDLQEGHFWSSDLYETRLRLHEEGVVPQVLLSGLGAIKGLRYNKTHIHMRRDCDLVCERLAKLY